MIRASPGLTRTYTLFPYTTLSRSVHGLAHGRLEVVVAHDAAGDAAGPGGDAALVDDEDVLAAALAARRQRLGQVQRGREAVDAGADDDNAAAVGKRHGGLLQERRLDRKSTRLNSSH